MKRSQMLQELKNEMMTLKRYVGDVSDDEMIERLLNCVERLGMLPPTYRDFKNETESALLVNKWEGE